MSEQDDSIIQLKLINSKLDILRNFLIVADDGLRQQQSAMNDEVISVMKDISVDIKRWLKGHT